MGVWPTLRNCARKSLVHGNLPPGRNVRKSPHQLKRPKTNMQNPTLSKAHPAPKDRFRSFLLGLAAALAAAVPMTSSAWTEIFPSSTLQVQDAGGTYHNQPGTTTSINYGDVRYS